MVGLFGSSTSHADIAIDDDDQRVHHDENDARQKHYP